MYFLLFVLLFAVGGGGVVNLVEGIFVAVGEDDGLILCRPLEWTAFGSSLDVPCCL